MSVTDTSVPGADVTAQAGVSAQNAYNQALTQINARRSQTLQSYGYLGDIDPTTGSVGNVRVDPTNPYGQLQSTLRANAQQDQLTDWDNLGRGLHGGLANQGLAENAYQHGQASAALGTNFANELQGEQGDQDTATQSRDAALYQAELQQAELAIENQQFTPADYSDIPIDYQTDTATDPGNGSGVTPQTLVGAVGQDMSRGVATSASPVGKRLVASPQTSNDLNDVMATPGPGVSPKAAAVIKKVISGYSQKSKAAIH